MLLLQLQKSIWKCRYRYDCRSIEILIIADDKNNPNHIAIDLLSQAVHDELAQSILVTNNNNFALEVKKV